MPRRLPGSMSTTKRSELLRRIALGLSLCLLSLSAPLRADNSEPDTPRRTGRLAEATMGLVPYPNAVNLSSGDYHLPRTILIHSEHPELEIAANMLDSLGRRSLAQYRLQRQSQNSTDAHIRFHYNPSLQSDESYRLDISPRGISIVARHRRGAIYGAMTLLQMLESHYDHRRSALAPLECLSISDSPRYALRGLMLDPARHFLPIADIKAYIDIMLRYKYNTLQLHLTDDQGWRFEVKHLSQLASREHYTREELKELLDYAQERGVDIIPEIDIPGHTAALLHALPELRIEAHRDSTFVLGKTDNVMLSAVAEQTYTALRHIFVELREIFPAGTRLHLGGDESAITRNWAQSPSHLELMHRLGYQQPEQLMDYFFARVYPMVRSLGFHPMQWCELDNVRLPAERYLMQYPQDVALVTWRMGLTPLCIELTRQSGHQLVLAPSESAYLDYPQWRGDLPEYNNWGMPITSLERSYNYDLRSGISAHDNQHILGVMATLWGEAIKDIHRAYYMSYPRALAIAEQGWTAHRHRSWHDFRRSVPYILNTLERQGIAHRRPVELYQ